MYLTLFEEINDFIRSCQRANEPYNQNGPSHKTIYIYNKQITFLLRICLRRVAHTKIIFLEETAGQVQQHVGSEPREFRELGTRTRSKATSKVHGSLWMLIPSCHAI